MQPLWILVWHSLKPFNKELTGPSDFTLRYMGLRATPLRSVLYPIPGLSCGNEPQVPTMVACFLTQVFCFTSTCCAVLSCSVVSNTLWPREPYPTTLLCPWDSPGQNTGVGCHALFQGIFPTQGLNPGLLHCRQSLYWLSYQGCPSFLYSPVVYPEKYIKLSMGVALVC